MDSTAAVLAREMKPTGSDTGPAVGHEKIVTKKTLRSPSWVTEWRHHSLKWEILQEEGFEGKYQEFSSGHVRFEIFIRHYSRDAK